MVRVSREDAVAILELEVRLPWTPAWCYCSLQDASYQGQCAMEAVCCMLENGGCPLHPTTHSKTMPRLPRHFPSLAAL